MYTVIVYYRGEAIKEYSTSDYYAALSYWGKYSGRPGYTVTIMEW